jgi:hypothetical protein
MSIAIHIGGLLIAAAAVASASAQNVVDEVDRFTGERKISYTAENPRPIDLRKPVFTLRGGIDSDGPGFVVQLVFAGNTDRRRSSWRFLSCNTVNWLVDGQPRQLGPVVHRGEVVRGGTLEFITQQIDVEDIARIGSARAVEYRVCHDEFELTQADIRAFAEVARLLGVPDSSSE